MRRNLTLVWQGCLSLDLQNPSRLKSLVFSVFSLDLSQLEIHYEAVRRQCTTAVLGHGETFIYLFKITCMNFSFSHPNVLFKIWRMFYCWIFAALSGTIVIFYMKGLELASVFASSISKLWSQRWGRASWNLLCTEVLPSGALEGLQLCGYAHKGRSENHRTIEVGGGLWNQVQLLV